MFSSSSFRGVSSLNDYIVDIFINEQLKIYPEELGEEIKISSFTATFDSPL